MIDILQDRFLPPEIWPSGVFKSSSRFRDRLLEKYNPGKYSKHYKFFYDVWSGFGNSHRTFNGLIGHESRELSWAC